MEIIDKIYIERNPEYKELYLKRLNQTTVFNALKKSVKKDIKNNIKKKIKSKTKTFLKS